ncbi:MAG: M48 family metallopeptidase [Bacilli bacterium]|nr:M48 family metallopeptidase [Bacilli bacterium]
MEFKIEENVYPVEIIRKKNKNTYIRVKSGKIISVTTNRWVSERQIEKLLKENVEALKKMLIKCQKEDDKKENFYILGTKYDIIIVSGIDSIEISGNKIFTPTKRKLELWYKSEMKKLFEEHLMFWYEQFEESIPKPKLKIRTMKTRWGVCNIKDNSVTLNSRLMEYDSTKLDYVIIHELSHFRHFNHSKDFWTLVSKYCPNYKEIRKALREE